MSEILRSTEIAKLVSALCKAQLAFDPILKESENPAFKRGNRVSKYADMFSLVTATRKHLNNNGLTLMQFPTITLEGKNLLVTTILAHESGEWISQEILLPAVDERGFTAHSIGKALTYARRYSWQSIIGAVAEEDDDGNDASGQGTHEQAQAVAAKKIEDLKAKKAQADPSKGPDQLVCYPSDDGYEVTGMPEVMNAHKELLLMYGKRLYVDGKPGKTIYMDALSLDSFKHEFCDNRGGILTSLKAKKIADDAKTLAQGVK